MSRLESFMAPQDADFLPGSDGSAPWREAAGDLRCAIQTNSTEPLAEPPRPAWKPALHSRRVSSRASPVFGTKEFLIRPPMRYRPIS
jgi:hypothetical protein